MDSLAAALANRRRVFARIVAVMHAAARVGRLAVAAWMAVGSFRNVNAMVSFVPGAHVPAAVEPVLGLLDGADDRTTLRRRRWARRRLPRCRGDDPWVRSRVMSSATAALLMSTTGGAAVTTTVSVTLPTSRRTASDTI